MPVETPVPDNDPLMIAWEAYKRTEEFANSKRWAMRIAPFVQASDPELDAKREQELMPRDQRSDLVDGALWAAFCAGRASH